MRFSPIRTHPFTFAPTSSLTYIYFSLYFSLSVFSSSFLDRGRSEPEVKFSASDGVEHCVWPVKDPVAVFAIQRAFEAVQTTYIADGHHRSASAFRYDTERYGVVRYGIYV